MTDKKKIKIKKIWKKKEKKKKNHFLEVSCVLSVLIFSARDGSHNPQRDNTIFNSSSLRFSKAASAASFNCLEIFKKFKPN